MAKKKEVVITCNATNVKAVIEGLERGMAALAKEEEKLLNTIKQRGYAENDEKKRLKELEKAMDAMRTNVQKNRDEQKKLGEVMKDLSGAKLKDLKKALQEGKAALNNMSAKDPGREKLVHDLKKIQAQIDANTGALKRNQSAWGALGTTMKNLFAYAGIFAGFNLLKSKLDEAYEANKRFSDSMANVRKVSGLTMDEIGKLANNLSKIDSRTGLGGLMELSYTGAKLGFGNYGIEGLESFAKSAVKVQNALSEDMGADAMTALSKMVEVMGLIPKMGVERAMDATGSAIFKLASTSTATGTNIVEFSKRLMGLANIAHISTQDLLAFGSAADSMALAPEVAATAFNKLITAVQKQPNLIENALHIEKGTISDLYQTGHMTEALVTIFEKMREKGGMNALMQSGVFKDLGSDGARLVAVMATMANRVDMLNAHLAVSRQAFEEGTAVAQEYAIQMDTAAAYSERAANIWQKAFVNPEGVDTVKEFTKAWYEVSKSLTSNKVAMAEVKFLLGGILELLKGILYFIPALLSGLAVLGAGRMFVALRSSLEMTRLSAVGLTLSINGLKTAWTALSAVGKANWIGAAATALFMIIEAFGMFNKKVQEATGYMKGFKKDLGDLNVEYGKAESELRRYRRAIDEANTGSKQRLAAINTFNSKFKPYLSNLLTEKSTAKDVADAYEAINKAIRAKLALQLKEKDIESQVAPRERWTAERRQEYEKRANEAGKGQYGSTWITGYAQDNRNKTIDAIVRNIGKQYYNLPQQIIDEVSKQAAAGNASFNNYGNIINSRYLKDANALLAASSYLRQERSAENALRRVNKKWEPEQKLIDDLTAQQDETPYEPLQDAPDKEALRAAKKAAQEHKKALKLEMDQAEKDSTAVINAIEEFYRLQESAVEQLVADGKMTREEADKLIDYVKNRKDTMLMNARRAIAGKDSDFENLRKTMGQDMLRPDDVNSQRAMNTVQTIDVAEAAKRLQKFDGSKAVYDLNAGSFTQAMLKNAAQNELNIQRRQAAVQVEIDKLLLQYQYVEQAQRDFGDKLVKMGLITDGYQKVVQQLADGTEIVANTNEVQGFANKVVGLGSSLYAVNPEDSASLQKLMYDVMTTKDKNGMPAMESFASIFPNFDKWMKQPGQYKDEMKAMYELMIQYEGIYYDKLKQRDDLQNKRLGSWWDHSDQKKENDKKLRNIQLYDYQYNTMHEGETMGFMMGLTNDLTHDPEVMREQAVLEAKIAIWKKAKEEREANLISEEVYQQKLRDAQDQTMAYSQKVMENINKRISRIQAFVKPVETAANTIGKKLGDMIFNMQSEESTWEQIWKNMALAMAESLLTMVGQYAQYQIQKAAINKSEVLDEAGKAQAITMLGISSGAAKTIGTLGWWGIALIPVITSLLMGLLTSALSTTNDSGNSASTTAPKTKLVSGMLTYDKGNVDKFAGRRKLYDDGTTQVYGRRRYLGEDGKVYTATAEPAPKDGLVTHPIATTVQGQPALVAENGPEIVIGRETTKAIMMNEPELIKYLANYQQHGGRRLFDSGNVRSTSGRSQGENVQSSMFNVQSSDISHQTSDAAAEREALINRLDRSDALMEQVLYYLQNPVAPEIAMYDTGGKKGLRSKMKEADRFMARYGG